LTTKQILNGLREITKQLTYQEVEAIKEILEQELRRRQKQALEKLNETESL